MRKPRFGAMFGLVLIALVLATIPVFRGHADEAKPKELVLAHWGGRHEQVLNPSLVEPFEKEHGIKIRWFKGSLDARMARLYAEKGNPSIDVAILSEESVPKALADGVIQPAEKWNIPSAVKIYPIAKLKGGIGIYLSASGIWYNPSKVDPPRSYRDLWNPKYKKRIALVTMPNMSTVTFLLMIARLNGGGVENIAPGFESLRKLEPYAFVKSTQEAEALFSQGVVTIMPGPYPAGKAFAAKGGPVDVVIPTEGAVVNQMVATIPVGAKHQKWSEAIVNELLSERVQRAYAEVGLSSPVRKVDLSVATKRVLFPVDESQLGQLVQVDWEKVATKLAAWTDQWNREVMR